MAKLLLLVIAVAVGAVVYPRYAEHTDEVCGAFAKRLEALVRAGHLPSPPIHYDDFARTAMQANFPEVPEVLRCTIGYWMLLAQPEMAEVPNRLVPK